jgi:hypothetical protein
MTPNSEQFVLYSQTVYQFHGLCQTNTMSHETFVTDRNILREFVLGVVKVSSR